MEVDRNGLEVLDRDECMRLLKTATLGRIGLTTGALPTVLPVNFRVIGDEIVVRTSRGSKLEAATDNAVVAFEVDDFDSMDHTGWSVVVTGVADAVTSKADIERLRSVPIGRWAPSCDDGLVTISTELVSGRRISR
jgi:nitroimidazol reductase NimA-like FMN-containing flavoprotein (pyridoxamine 5'-phosphate oxidase superfamily)